MHDELENIILNKKVSRLYLEVNLTPQVYRELRSRYAQHRV